MIPSWQSKRAPVRRESHEGDEPQPSYDAAGNVASVTTTLAAVGSTPGGSETQAFCYDDLDRLTWASSATGTPTNAMPVARLDEHLNPLIPLRSMCVMLSRRVRRCG